MRIENFKEIEPGLWTCRVSTLLRNANQSQDVNGWHDWYMPPGAMAQIGQYLQATRRDWCTEGAVWLTERSKPLSRTSQGAIMSRWLKLAGCSFTGVHVLRRTGIDRLLNKYKLPLPIVQAIAQCHDLTTLLQYYHSYSLNEAARLVNPLLTTLTEIEPDETT